MSSVKAVINSLLNSVTSSCRPNRPDGGSSPSGSASPTPSLSDSSSNPKTVLVLVGFDEDWPSYKILKQHEKLHEFRVVLAKLGKYSDGTPNISLPSVIHRQEAVYVIGTGHNLFEMDVVVKYLMTTSLSVQTIYTYVPHLRDDKSSREARADLVTGNARKRVEIPTAPYVVESIGRGGAMSNLIVEPHTLQIASSPKVSAQDMMPAMARFIIDHIGKEHQDRICWVFPDAGAKSRYGDQFTLGGHMTVACDKVRENATTTRTTFSLDPSMQAELDKKDYVVIMDDLISSGGTMLQALAMITKRMGRKPKSYMGAFHIDPTGNAVAQLHDLIADGTLEAVIVSDSNPRGVSALGADSRITVFPIGSEIVKILS